MAARRTENGFLVVIHPGHGELLYAREAERTFPGFYLQGPASDNESHFQQELEFAYERAVSCCISRRDRTLDLEISSKMLSEPLRLSWGFTAIN
jgi:hypothetical protein